MEFLNCFDLNLVNTRLRILRLILSLLGLYKIASWFKAKKDKKKCK